MFKEAVELLHLLRDKSKNDTQIIVQKPDIV